MIHVININTEDYSNKPNYYYIGRPSILGNPYTHLPLETTKAIYKCTSRDIAIEKYSEYFDLMYGHNKDFTKIINEIYTKYKNGEEIYLGCHCSPLPCHGNIIQRKLEGKLLKEKLTELSKNNKKL